MLSTRRKQSVHSRKFHDVVQRSLYARPTLQKLKVCRMRKHTDRAAGKSNAVQFITASPHHTNSSKMVSIIGELGPTNASSVLGGLTKSAARQPDSDRRYTEHSSSRISSFRSYEGDTFSLIFPRELLRCDILPRGV